MVTSIVSAIKGMFSGKVTLIVKIFIKFKEKG